MPVRIYDIAKRLGVESKEVLAKAKELGIPGAKVPSSSLDKITAEYLYEQLAGSLPPRPETPPPAPEPVLVVTAPVEEPPPMLVAEPPVVESEPGVTETVVAPVEIPEVTPVPVPLDGQEYPPGG